MSLNDNMKPLWWAVGILVAALAQGGMSAVNVQLTQEDIRRATELARFPHTDADRRQFHNRYTIVVNSPVVEYFAVEKIEVITPFRRMELIAEEHARINDLFARGGLQDAEDAVRPWRDRVSIVTHLRFDLTKLVPGVPTTDVTLEGSRHVDSIAIKTSEIHSRDSDQAWLVGALVEAAFDIQDVGQTTQQVVVRCNGKEVARVTVGFAAME